jgi:hypothetical protein
MRTIGKVISSNLSRRLERLEARIAPTSEREPRTMRFVNVDGTEHSTLILGQYQTQQKQASPADNRRARQ